MEEDLISKKELLEQYQISYGALYRWKRVVDICHDEQTRAAVAVQSVVDRAETHRADSGQHGHFAALDDAHGMLIGAGLRVVHGVECADDAAHRLSQRAIEIGVGIVRQQIVGQQRLDV